MSYFYLIIALLAGILGAAQSPINAELTRNLNQQPLLGAFFSFLVGTITLFFLVWWKSEFAPLKALPNIPLWSLSGGLLGVVFVMINILLVPKLGVTALFFMIILGQIIAAMMIDYFGLLGMNARPLHFSKIVGLIVILIGLGLFFWGEKLFK